METIGQRAAKLIRERCTKWGSLGIELEKLEMVNTTLCNWENGKYDPSAHFLQLMAMQGYDVMYVLLGGQYGKE